MPRFENAEAAFDVPNDWDDKTVVAFSAKAKPNTIVPNAVLTRDSLKAGENCDAFVNRMIVEMAKGLGGFTLLSKEPRKLGDIDGFIIEYTWRGSAGKVVLQRLVVAVTNGKDVIGLNVTCAETDAKKYAPITDRILASFKPKRATG